ncbi:hypothetical protein BH24ACT7_BH24ACT7_24130 [soil metagenome]
MTTPPRTPTPGNPGPEPSISPPQRAAQGSTAEVAEALDIARRLAAAGIPIFRGRPNPLASTGFTLPPRWQNTVPDPAAVDHWRPGDALCLVTGYGLDGADIDPRNGGTLAALDGFRPDSYGEQDTPSGGEHLLVKSLGVGSRDNVLPGIDVKAGTPGGADHGFLFIAPTVRRSKVTGALVAYRWRRPPDLDALADEGPDDTTGAALAELVRQARGEGGGEGGRSAVQGEALFAAPGLFDSGPWSDIPGELAQGRHRAVHRLASALRGRGGWRTDDAALLLDACVWPLIDQQQGSHPYPRAEFLADIADVFERYADGPRGAAAEDGDGGTLDGWGFITRAAAAPPALWGADGEVLAAAGEPTVLAAAEGVGKTTLLHRYALARVGIGGDLLGYPIAKAERPVLLVAADRPAQAARSLARMVTEADRGALAQLRVWRGPLPFRLSDDKARVWLPEFVEEAGCGEVLVDTLGAVAIDLAKDEGGARVAAALSATVAAGFDVLATHHDRKPVQGGRKIRPDAAEIYGSRWITATAGSVLYLAGLAGDPLVTLYHLKAPAGEVGPLQLTMDPAAGIIAVTLDRDPLELVRLAGRDGLTALQLAEALYGMRASPADRERARRRLEKLAAGESPRLVALPTASRTAPRRYVLAGPREVPQ